MATGSLAAGASAGDPNLYLRHGGSTTFIATLSPRDDNNEIVNEAAQTGDWQPGLGQRTAEATPAGRGLVFMSSRSLTGYDNEGLREVFVYDAETEHLFCASCDPSGAPPAGTGPNAAFLPLGFSGEGGGMYTYQPRWISEDGSRVFFDSAEDPTSRKVEGPQEVYEWERDGAGSCRTTEGCVYLLSGGASTDISAFIDASASGEDVFFVTRARLVPQDRSEYDHLYDARVDGVQPLSSPECTGTGCQGVPSAPPLFATPPSVTFNGVGDVEPPPAGARGEAETEGEGQAVQRRAMSRSAAGGVKKEEAKGEEGIR